MTQPIKIEGLAQFRKSLKQMDSDLPKAIRVALNTAMDIIVGEAKPRIPRRTGRAAASLKVSSTQGKARVKAGGSKAPYFPWLDFGGRRVGRGGGVATRPFRKQGRYVWKAFGDRRDDVIEALEVALADVAKQAGLEVTRSGE